MRVHLWHGVGLGAGLVLGACKDKEGPAGDDSAPPLHTAESCAEAAPVIGAFTAVDGGTIEQEDGDVWPAVLFHIEVNDTDGDLDVYRWEVSFDVVVDGAVTADVYNTYTKEGETTGVDACVTTTRSLDYAVAVTGVPLVSGTPTEWLAVFQDKGGLRSEGVLATITLP